MSYPSTESCVLDLERAGHLVRIKEEVDPHLEMASIHLRVHEAGGPALLFERVKGSSFRAVSNLYGTLDRCKFIFRHTLPLVQQMVQLRLDPMQVLKQPGTWLKTLKAGAMALPLRNAWRQPVRHSRVHISDLPQVQCWPRDGGAFVTLPLVYTEGPNRRGPMNGNLGMYRIQLSGNAYELNREVGLHYQLHRGIGVHQTEWNQAGKPMPVSVWVGGPPALTVAAVMPLPEGLSELLFAGVLGGRRVRYSYDAHGACVATDADFVITGLAHPNQNKPEGPFGDHLGYYSLQHPFPVMEVHTVYARKNAIWPFTVVGRPPQEDTAFGDLIHEITGPVLPKEIPGLLEVNAVDAAGVHPLLLAIGQERYTPYLDVQRPAELLTIANHCLGKGQLSLAKFLFICDKADQQNLSTRNIKEYFRYFFERADWTNDLHFYTRTSIDTLDYSGDGLNTGSKLVLAAAGRQRYTLSAEVPSMHLPSFWNAAQMVMPGVLALSGPSYTTQPHLDELLGNLETQVDLLRGIRMVVVCDDAAFAAKTINNWLWVTFTRTNPSHDVYGLGASQRFKHWGCSGAVVFDARIKPHHAPALELDPSVERRVDALFASGGSLHGIA